MLLRSAPLSTPQISTLDYTVNVRNEHRGAQTNVSWTKEVEIIYKGIFRSLLERIFGHNNLLFDIKDKTWSKADNLSQ